MNKENKPFIMNKDDDKKKPKKTPEKELMDLSDLLIDNSNKTMILDLSELEFDDKNGINYDEFLLNSKSASNINIDTELDELDDLDDEKTIDNFQNLGNLDTLSNSDKTVVISIEDIIEADNSVETESLVNAEDILEETLDGLKTTSNTFIKNIDFKMSSNLVTSELPEKEYKKIEIIEVVEDVIDVNLNIEASSEKLLDFLIYGKIDEFEKELSLLQEDFDNNIVDLIKYMFEFYVKKDD